MSLSEEHTADTIERYIQGRMSEKERIAFEQLVKTDPELSSKLEMHKVMQAFMVEEGLKDIRQMVQQDFGKMKNNNRGKWLGISLATLAISGSFLYYLNSDAETSTKNDSITSATTLKETSSNTASTENKITSASSQNQSQIAVQKTESKIISSNDRDPVQKENDLSTSLNTATEKIEPQNSTEKTILPPTKTTEKKEENNCNNFRPDYRITVQPTVVGQNSGKIIVTSKDKNLRYALNEGESESMTNFEDLKKGSYTIKISNSVGCQVIESGIQVPSTYCLNLEGEKYNTSQEENYKFPFTMEDIAEVQIYDKRNQLIRVLHKQETDTWDGKNKEGSMAETGLYRIIGLYANGEKCYYSLTVFN